MSASFDELPPKLQIEKVVLGPIDGKWTGSIILSDPNSTLRNKIDFPTYLIPGPVRELDTPLNRFAISEQFDTTDPETMIRMFANWLLVQLGDKD